MHLEDFETQYVGIDTWIEEQNEKKNRKTGKTDSRGKDERTFGQN